MTVKVNDLFLETSQGLSRDQTGMVDAAGTGSSEMRTSRRVMVMW
jgi:hypothetical protein